MLFTSYQFILFLIILFFLYYCIPKKLQWVFLLIGSYIFYFLAGPSYLIYIFITTVTTYLATIGMQRYVDCQKNYLKEHELSREEKKKYKAKITSKRRLLLILCLIVNIGILAVSKYANFTIGIINSLTGLKGSEGQLPTLNLIVPLGISFYTFQTMGYLVDVYWEKYDVEKNLGKLALFVSFFPQLIQGPISRFSDLSKTLFEKHYLDGKTVCLGLERILWGYFKKLVIADRILVGVKTIIGSPENYQGSFVFVGMIFYALELYADFTGGIDITIGIAQTLGIKVEENFIRPYFSKSIAEYWRRWHISMGTWFKDYIFYPISMSTPMLNVSKKCRKFLGNNIGKKLPVYIATLVTWFVTGIWHGASGYFIAWGMMNCLVIMISQELEPVYNAFHKRFPGLSKKRWYTLFQVPRTFLLMCSLRMFDCYQNVGLTFKMFLNMFKNFSFGIFYNGSLLKLGLSLTDYCILFIGTILLIATSLAGRKESVREILYRKPIAIRIVLSYLLLVVILLFGIYGSGYDATQFIYNQF